MTDHLLFLFVVPHRYSGTAGQHRQAVPHAALMPGKGTPWRARWNRLWSCPCHGSTSAYLRLSYAMCSLYNDTAAAGTGLQRRLIEAEARCSGRPGLMQSTLSSSAQLECIPEE